MTSQTDLITTPLPPPPTSLAIYQILSSTAGIRVSPLCLGGMSLGTAWSKDMGPVPPAQAFALLDAYHNAGGNFIDTANHYQNGESEEVIGSWMEERGNRDLIVLATKFTCNWRMHEAVEGGVLAGPPAGRGVNYWGNHKKSLMLSVENSLKRLKTGYIDLLYVHWWDWTTGIAEVMESLHLLVEQGKVLYLGVSNTPAWIVAAANEYALFRGRTPFSVFQGPWNVINRDLERDVIPMVQHYGMALVPWNVLGGGKLQSRTQVQRRKESGDQTRSMYGTEQTEAERNLSAVLEEIAHELQQKSEGAVVQTTVSIQQVALAYVRHKAGASVSVIPLVGGRKIEYLQDNIAALDLTLSEKQVSRIDSAKHFDFGFPRSLCGPNPNITGRLEPPMNIFAHMAFPQAPQTIARAARAEH